MPGLQNTQHPKFLDLSYTLICNAIYVDLNTSTFFLDLVTRTRALIIHFLSEADMKQYCLINTWRSYEHRPLCARLPPQERRPDLLLHITCKSYEVVCFIQFRLLNTG